MSVPQPPLDPSAFEEQSIQYYEPPPQKSAFVRYWEKVGGGSLTVSVILHAALLMLAVLIYFGVHTPQKEDAPFLSGGGGGQGGVEKSAERQRERMRQRPAQVRIASSAVSAGAVSLPDVNTNFNFASLSAASAKMAGAGSGSGRGGGHGSGIGTGTGSGVGPGSLSGFVSVPASIFGDSSGQGLPGTLYDMKQSADGKPVVYNGTVEEYFPRLYEVAAKRFSQRALSDFYKAKVTLNFSILAVPNAPAEDGPKAFQAEKEIRPRGWFVHYTGRIDPPVEGEWRFAGIFDDALLVYIDNRLVLDGSWDSPPASEDVRQPMGTIGLLETRFPYYGKWVRIKRGSKIDILVGERPGGLVGGALMIQQKGKKYDQRPDGSLILPVFAMVRPRPEDLQRMEKIPYGFAKETPIFKLHKDGLGL